MLPENDIKEGLSKAYVKAVCNSAGYSLANSEKDFGFDYTVIEVDQRDTGRVVETGWRLDLQLKSTINYEERDGFIIYDLAKKNYNDLVDKSGATPRILVLVLLPQERSSWVEHDINALIIRKCAFWCYLGGNEPADNEEGTKRIKIPMTNLFNMVELTNIMDKIKTGEGLDGE